MGKIINLTENPHFIISKMKAIISNHKRSQVYEKDITFEGLQAYIKTEFPRAKEPKLFFTDLNGTEVAIKSEEDLSLLKKIYDGQNFVQIRLDAKGHGHGHGHGRRHHGQSHEHHAHRHSSEKGHGKDKKAKRTNVLAKVYGGEPSQFESFEEENKNLPMGKLIKAYAEKNGITTPVDLGHKAERRTKVLAKVFKGQPQDFEEFQKANETLRLGELIQKYSEEKGIDIKDKKPWNKELHAGRIEKKTERLAIVLGNSEENKAEAATLVKENPSMNVKQILEKLQKEGREVNMQKFKEIKQAERANKSPRHHHDRRKSEERKPRSPKMKEETPVAEIQLEENFVKPANKKQAEIREKGKILMQMKQIFGPERSSEYYKFINEHFEEGEDAILEKWIKTHEI